jgi:hypothetical protein
VSTRLRTLGHLVGAVVAAGVVVAVAAWWNMDPQPVLLGALVLVVLGGAWAVGAVARSTAPPVAWPPAQPAEDDHRIDWQVAALRIRVEFGATERGSSDRLRESLVAIVDDRLEAEHGIDRREDPQAARAVLGDDLSRFVVDPGGSPWRRKDLERIVTRIEAL